VSTHLIDSGTRRILAERAARAGTATFLFGLSAGIGALFTMPFPLQTRILAAGAATSAVAAVALWSRKPAAFVAAFLFVLPLLERRHLGGGLDPGEAATLILVSLGCLSALVYTTQVPQRVRLILWALAGLAAFGAISTAANGISSVDQLATSVLKPVSWAVVIYLVILHFDSEDKLRALLLTIICSGTAVAASGVIQFVTGHAPVSPSGGIARADGTFEHFNQLGGFMALVAVPTAAFAFSAKAKSVRIMLGAALILQLTALLLSGTLGSMLGLAVASVVSIRLWGVNPRIGVWLTIVPVLGLVIAALFAPAQSRRVYLVDERANDRLQTYAAGIAIAEDHLLFGTGSVENALAELQQNPKYRYTRFGQTSSEPHNVFLEAFVILGLPGLLVMVSLGWLSLRLLLRSRPRSDDPNFEIRWGIILGGIAFLVQNFTNNLLAHARLGIIFLVLVVIAARLRELQARADDTQRADPGPSPRATREPRVAAEPT
jgi:O-antigen ligase